MMTIVKQSHEEMLAMYMKCKKKELAEMLANRDYYADITREEAQDCWFVK